jgi:hypothetical protein
MWPCSQTHAEGRVAFASRAMWPPSQLPTATNRCETTAQLLEDLAAHADNDEERQRCLAVARNFRLAA